MKIVQKNKRRGNVTSPYLLTQMSLAFRKERDILATPKQGEVGLQSVQIRSICVFRVLLKNGTPIRRIQRIEHGNDFHSPLCKGETFFAPPHSDIRAKSVQSVCSVFS
jgi:hypothetical protein